MGSSGSQSNLHACRSCRPLHTRQGAALPRLLHRLHGPGSGRRDTDLGLNLLFGLGLKGNVVPYVQGKVIVSDDTEFVIGIGVRF
jgi:hypothetical protein